MTNVAYAAALLAAVSVSPSSALEPSPMATWVWPLSPPVIVRRFEPPPTPYAAGHRGVDLDGSAGQMVVAAGAGVVSFSGQVAGVGVVVVRHGALRTTYEPVVPTVAAGALVTAGQPIGRLTPGHHGCDVCLHFGLRAGEDYLDPVSLFAHGPIRLLPLDPATVGWWPDVGAATSSAEAVVSDAPPDGPGRARLPAAGAAVGATVVGLASVSLTGATLRRRTRRRGFPR
jgi:murein DD-endopeptidase MepM/ murein hydrolase activator NlpD